MSDGQEIVLCAAAAWVALGSIAAIVGHVRLAVRRRRLLGPATPSGRGGDGREGRDEP